jgi:hypothetical protein
VTHASKPLRSCRCHSCIQEFSLYDANLQGRRICIRKPASSVPSVCAQRPNEPSCVISLNHAWLQRQMQPSMPFQGAWP